MSSFMLHDLIFLKMYICFYFKLNYSKILNQECAPLSSLSHDSILWNLQIGNPAILNSEFPNDHLLTDLAGLFVFGKRFALTMPISLNTVVIFNFKSFSEETIVGPIQPFTAIIGPNGSGKSNIMDAISFALGEKPIALRVKRLSELVYRVPIGESTDTVERDTYVKVIFRINGINESSFTRTIHGETSQYKIGDKIVTNVFYMAKLREMGLNIKAENFLIPQGYIECFAMKMPKDLTAMFELISNSNEYKENYERLKSELLKAEEEVYFQHLMKKEILIQKKYAIAEKAETEKYLKLKEQYNKKMLKFQLIRLLLIKKGAESLQDKERKIKLQIDEYLRKKKTMIDLLEQKKSECKSLSSSLEDIEQVILKVENVIQQRKIEHIVFEENLSYWQKKRDHACVSLDSASKARNTNKRIIQELKDELKQIDSKLTELRKASQTSTMELSNSQVKCYMELMNEAECQAKDFVKQINSLMHDQQEDQDKLDNENRREEELEAKIKQMRLTKENLEIRLQKLQDLSAESKATLMERTAKIQELNQKITGTKDKSLSLENDIEKIIKELSEADIDSRQIKKNETIKMLKQFHFGVHGRLSDLCNPIHSRYKVAITKVFGKNMDAIVTDTRHTAIQCIQFLKQHKIDIETFLPLDSIKKIFLKEQLRTIKEPTNVKLLYDLLNISSPQINKAVLFVTKNTLVCETIEDARILACELNKQKAYDCVSLDGCFYRKDGTISGGQADLIVKAKRWDKQHIFILEERKAQLIKELRNLPKISFMQSELDIINVQIKGLTLQNKYMEIDIKDTKDEIVKINEKLDMLDKEVIVLNMAIVEIQNNMQERDKKIKNMEKYVKTIKDKIFVNFCKDINVPDISYYEKNNLRIYQEQKTKQMELEQQYNRIENQLRFENENDTKSKVLKWKQAVEQADAELNKIYQQERHVKIKIEREETQMSKLKDNCTNMKKNLENVEKELVQHKLQIDDIEKLYLESQKAHIVVQKEIEKKKIKCNTILKECKIKDIIIPMSISHHKPEESIFTSSSSSIAESSEGCEVLTKIDFSQFPEDIRNSTEKDLQDMAEQLKKIQNEFKDIKPNLKVHEKIDSIAQQMQEINTNLQNCRNKYNKMKTQFELTKAKRYKLFSDSLERIAAEIDSIYKSLVNDTSAQAIILPDNPEEPYAGNIIYNCIVPSKGFQPLQYLSGGEKSLASLALLFAIQCYKQIPFLIMDEGDTALDKTNIKNVVRFIQSKVNTMQFIAITLHKGLYCNADVLIGVTTKRDISCNSEIFAISLNGYNLKTRKTT